jgi:EARP and GARP complex-interacting protein 1
MEFLSNATIPSGTYTEHEDSIYSVAWGDAWAYASLSYDGKLAVNLVPSEEKYAILL